MQDVTSLVTITPFYCIHVYEVPFPLDPMCCTLYKLRVVPNSLPNNVGGSWCRFPANPFYFTINQ